MAGYLSFAISNIVYTPGAGTEYTLTFDIDAEHDAQASPTLEQYLTIRLTDADGLDWFVTPGTTPPLSYSIHLTCNAVLTDNETVNGPTPNYVGSIVSPATVITASVSILCNSANVLAGSLAEIYLGDNAEEVAYVQDTVPLIEVDTQPTVDLTATATEIAYGDSFTLEWTSTNATAVVDADTNFAATTVSGSLVVTPEGPMTYRIKVTDADGDTATDEVTVNVTFDPGDIIDDSDGDDTGGVLGKRFRIITTDMSWPAGDPPYAPVEGVVPIVYVPPLPDDPPAYDSATFNPTIWTECTALCSEYHYTQDALMPIDQLSISIPAAWSASDRERVWREMRVIVIQEQFTDGVRTTEWQHLCWCISDGVVERWTNGVHSYVCEAKNALKLANVEILGALDGQVVYQGDTIRYGSPAAPVDLVLVNEDSEAYEYALTSDGTGTGAIYRDWADIPQAQFWATGVPHAPGGNPVPLAIAGSAVIAIYGEGILRLGKTYVATPHGGPTSAPDFSVGLGMSTAPGIKACFNRFALPAGFKDINGATIPSDIVDNLVVSSSGTGSVVLSSAVPVWKGLTLICRDGSGRRFRTTIGVGSSATVTLTDTTATIANGTPVSYGDANRVTDVLTRVFLDAGYQQQDATKALYLYPLPNPTMPAELGQGEIILPPLVLKSSDGRTPLGLVEELRQNGMIPPNYHVVADAYGRVQFKTVTQLAAGAAGLLKARYLPAQPGIEHERTDLNISTRVVVRGKARILEDLALLSDTHVAGGLAIANATAGNSLNPVDVAYYEALNYSPDPNHPRVYPQVDLNVLLRRDITNLSVEGTARPWRKFYFLGMSGDDYTGDWRDWPAVIAMRAGLEDHDLFVLTLGTEPVTIDAIELLSANLFNQTKVYQYCDGWDGDSRHWRYDGRTALGVYYWTEGAWQLLASGIVLEDGAIDLKRVDSNAFTTRGPVTTTKLMFRCESTWAAFWFNEDKGGDTVLTGIWLSQVRVWSNGLVRGIAELGNAANYQATGETNEEALYDTAPSTFWTDVRTRLRRRTFEVPDDIAWVQDEDTANWLAREWLRERVTDLAAWKFAAIRPEVRVHDTMELITPTGETLYPLILSTDFTNGMVVSLTGSDMRVPYFDDEGA